MDCDHTDFEHTVRSGHVQEPLRLYLSIYLGGSERWRGRNLQGLSQGAVVNGVTDP